MQSIRISPLTKGGCRGLRVRALEHRQTRKESFFHRIYEELGEIGMIVQTFLNGKIFQVFEIQGESGPGLNGKEKRARARAVAYVYITSPPLPRGGIKGGVASVALFIVSAIKKGSTQRSECSP